ncbi:MAG: sulfatase [Deltaproteobacteria bacterium]|nr:sulfatase [Deltaproteobacteria bacterium]
MWVQARPVPEQGTERRQFAIDRLPVGARLAFSYGVESPGWENHAPAVRFEVAAEGEETPLFSARLDPASDPLARRWFDASIDLSTHAGSPLTLTLQTSIEPGDPGGAPTVPVWGDPVVLAPGSPTRAVPRNLLLISIDTERAPSLSTYGRSRVTSPFFDALANEGALFEKAVVQSTLTPVSHMSLFTGLYPYAHGITDLKRPSDLAAYSTMAELLRRSGYATGAVTEDGLLQAAIGFERGFDRYLENKSPDVGSTAGHVESTFAAALDWLKLHRNQRWFLFVHTYQVHAPYTPPPQYQGLFGEERDLDRYEEEIRYTDDQLHALWAAVGALVLADRTLLIVTSDHGEEFGEHGASDHGSHLYDETLLVPLLMRAPGMIPTGLRVREPVALVDVLPTVLGILGLPALHQSHGESLTPLFDRDPAKRDAFRSTLASRPIYAEAWGAIRVLADGSRDSAWKPPAYALRAQNQKLIWTPPARDSDSPGRMEAYDLANDPGEEQDLWISHSAELTSPSDMLRAYASSSETTRPVDASAPPEPDPATAEKLRALGYIR